MPPVDIGRTGLTVITWNQHEDFGDLEQLLNSYKSKSPIVALLQEVARKSDSVPPHAPPSVKVPRRIAPKHSNRQHITEIARKLNLNLAYLPSMPNGRQTREDRGCAILSTLPLSDVTGIELPWVSQRRVAVMATLTALKNGVPWRLRVVSLHLDNRLRRSQQGAAIADFLAQHDSAHLPTIVGGDLNAWLGIRDPAVREINRIVPLVRECTDEGTYLWLALRLDHLFTTMPREARTRCVIERQRFGSDHHPLVLYLYQQRQKPLT